MSDHSQHDNSYPEIHPESSRPRILEIQRAVEEFQQQIWEETQRCVEATHNCNEPAFYQIGSAGTRAYRLSLQLSGLLMELSSIGGNLSRQVTQARETRQEQRQQQRRQ